MSSPARLAAVLLLAASFSGCGSGAPPTTDGSATDGSATDGSTTDSGATVDSATAGKDAGNPNTGSLNLAGTCSISSGGSIVTCTEYGEGFMNSVVMMGCVGAGVTYSSSDCPTANRVGHCDITEIISGHTITESISHYPPATTATAMQQCMDEDGGNMTTVFTPN